MSVLKPGDEDLHYADNSHRWLCPDDSMDADAWTARVKAHMDAHGYRRDTPSRLVIQRTNKPGNRRG